MTPKTSRRAFLATGAAAFAAGARLAEAQTAPAASGPPAVEIYAGSPLVDQIALSPDGQRIAIVTQKGDEKILLHYEIANPQPKSLSIGGAKVRDLFWGDNAHVILVDSQTTALTGFAGYRHEFTLARCIAVDTGEATTFFSNMEGFSNVVLGGLHRVKTPDGYRVTAANYRLHTDDGTVSVHDVVGKVWAVVWPADRIKVLHRPSTFNNPALDAKK